VIVPSIDILGGHAVQLVGGDPDRVEVDAGPPSAVAERYARTGPLAVIDLDAALGRGNNEGVIRDLCRRYRCRVGGGIRSIERAMQWLDAGAEQVILGTAARPEILSQLPRDRVMAAVDARQGRVVVDGWRSESGHDLLERIEALREYVGGFLVTVVEREGRLGGTDLELAAKVVAAAGNARVTWAGGVSSANEIAELDALSADAQVGMALYTGRLPLVDAFLAPVRSDRPDGLIPTVVSDVAGRALGLVYSDRESVEYALEQGVGAYHSRSRGGLWIKGATSGATQRLLRVDVDCDRDALRFVVEQSGEGFCHLGTEGCFGDAVGLAALERTLRARWSSAPEGSYTRRLFDDPRLLAAKIKEEAAELVEAEDPDHLAEELADVLYFGLVKLVAHGRGLADVATVLDRRARRVTRRPGAAKSQHVESPSEAPQKDDHE